MNPDLGFIHRFEPGTKDAPVLLLLHGTGGDEHDRVPLGRALCPGAALRSPRGRVLEHGAPRFFRRLAMGVFDEPDLIARTRELAGFVGAAAAAYGLDAARVIAVGLSNGANIAASMLLLEPAVLRAAWLLRPMVPLAPAAPPDLAGREVLIAAGRRDPLVTPDNTERLAAMLRDAGAGVTLHWSNAGHELAAEDLAAGRDWLARVGAPAV